MNTDDTGRDEKFDSEGAASYLGLNPVRGRRWLESMRSQGRGPAYLKYGTMVFYRRADLDAYVLRARVETADSRPAAEER